MAEGSGRLETITGLTAAADLSGKQYHIVRGSAANAVNQASNAAATSVLGVLQNKPKITEAAAVGFLGVSKIVAGAAVTAMDLISTNASGRAITCVSGAVYIGRALEAAGADGDVITAVLFGGAVIQPL